jgi:preprotein translocase subunit SecF
MISRLLVITLVRRAKPVTLPIVAIKESTSAVRPLITWFPQEFNIEFISKRRIALTLSALLLVVSFGSLAVQKLNFGIDFAGGILLEVRADQPVDVSAVRAQVGTLGLGDVAITTFGDTGRDLSIRIQRQEGGDAAQTVALNLVQETLGDSFDNRRTELVGPKVGSELVTDGALAVGLALLAICIYIWFRFEWQFAVGATLALSHDIILTLGMFSIFQLDFNLTTVAAILTIAGYSINDTVVAYDRVREMLRKYKKLPLPELVNLALNRVLSRTLLTSFTTLLAVMALFIFGGEVLRGFSLALIWGVIIGTYSSIYVAMPVLIYFNLRHEDLEVGAPSVSQVPEAERA